MSVSLKEQSLTAPAAPDQEGFTDSADLRVYVQVLIDWWLVIVATALILTTLVAVTFAVLKALEVPMFQATSTIAIVRVSSNVTFDDRYLTISEDSAGVQPNAVFRRSALLRLVENGSIAEAVIDELGDILDDTLRQPAALMRIMSAEILTRFDNDLESDLIAIHIDADDPDTAAAIANAWATHYVEQVNALYGQVPEEIVASVEQELILARENYQGAQRNLEAFIADNQVKKLERLITEKQGIIDALQVGKQTAIDALLEEELNARRQVISAYITALSENRLLAFNKEQESKQQLITAYIDAEMQSQLLAIQKDREARDKLFQTVTTSQLDSVTSVVESQIQDRIVGLEEAYGQRSRYQDLLGNAQLMEAQIGSGGEATVSTNAAAITLLKTQVVAINNEQNPITLQLDAVPLTETSLTAEEQLSDVRALVEALQQRIDSLNDEIESLSTKLLKGDDLISLDEFAASSLGVSALFTPTVDGREVAEDQESATLSTAAVELYLDLFTVGSLAQGNTTVASSKESDLFEEISHRYPELFSLGELSQLLDSVEQDNPLALISVEKAKELLQLQGLEEISAYSASADPLNIAIEQLENDIQTLEARLDAESARKAELTQQKDLTWETFKTLSNKLAELQLEQNATDSEVRLAIRAIPPIEPLAGINVLRNVILAGGFGLALGIFVALFANYLGYQPFLRWRWN